MRYRFGRFTLDETRAELLRDEEPVLLTNKAFAVLTVLVKSHGRVVTTRELMQTVWAGSFVERGSVAQNVFILRKLLAIDGDNPIETQPRQGYIFRKSVEILDAPEDHSLVAGLAAPDVPAETGSRLLSKRTPLWIWPAALALVALIAIQIWQSYRQSHRLGETPIAVLPFRSLNNDPTSAWLSGGLREMLSTDLTANTSMALLPEESVDRAMQELHLPQTDGLSIESLRKLHDDLGCDRVITASYIVTGGMLRVDLRVVNTLNGRTLATFELSDPSGQLQPLIAGGSADIRRQFGIPVRTPADDTILNASMPSDSQASQAYVDGLSLMRQFDNAHAISRLKQSIAIDPQFALSHAALATALSAVGIPKQAAEEADRAAALDTNLSHETQLEVLAQAQGIHNNFAGEQQTYQQLVDLHPANLANRFLLAHASMDAGHSRDALAMLNQLRATNKDAVNDPSISSAFADVYATLGDYPNSLASAQKAADQAKARGAQILYGRILCTVAQANLHLNRLPSAEQEAIQSLSISREFHDYSAEFRALNRLGQIYTAMNRMNDAENVLQQALDRERALGEQDRQVHTLSALGVIASGQGDHARALDYFTQQYQAAVTSGRKKFQLTAEYHLAEEHALVGDLPRAQREIAQVIATAVSLGDKETERYAILESAKIFLQQKKPDDGLRIIQAGLPSASGSADWLAQFSDMQARLWIMKGNAGSASDSIAAEQKSLQPGSPQDQARLQQTKLLLANISTSQNVQGHPK